MRPRSQGRELAAEELRAGPGSPASWQDSVDPAACPPVHRVLAEIAAGRVRGDSARHLDGCDRCTELVAAAHRRASEVFAAGAEIDCDDALLLISCPDEFGADGGELASILIHFVDCDVCRDVSLMGEDGADGAEDGAKSWPVRRAGDADGPDGHGSPGDGDPAHADFPRLPVASRRTFVWGPELGRGGMGRVTRVRDRRLGRTLVIKEPLVEEGQTWAERQALCARLEREARVTAGLDHPSIVAVHEAGRWPTGEPFYAMRQVSGIPLDQAISRGASVEDRLGLLPNVIAATEAMAYAHTRRIVHRDLKPHNILVGEFGETVVIDWGLAKELCGAGDDPPSSRVRSIDEPSLGRAELSTSGHAVGTPAFMAPEQATGQAVDVRADVYALGAILYHLMAGRAPYSDHEGRSRVLSVLARGAPTPLAQLAPGAPPALVSIVRRAMARRPAARYADAGALAADLRRFQQGRLVGTHHYTPWQLIAHVARKYRSAVATAAVLLVALAIIGVYSVHAIARTAADARTEAARARAAEAEAESNAAAAEQQRARAEDSAAMAEQQRARAEDSAAAAAREAAAARAAQAEAERAKALAEEATRKLRSALSAAREATLRAESEAERARQAEAHATAEAERARRARAQADVLHQRERERERRRLERALRTYGILTEELR